MVYVGKPIENAVYCCYKTGVSSSNFMTYDLHNTHRFVSNKNALCKLFYKRLKITMTKVQITPGLDDKGCVGTDEIGVDISAVFG